MNHDPSVAYSVVDYLCHRCGSWFSEAACGKEMDYLHEVDYKDYKGELDLEFCRYLLF